MTTVIGIKAEKGRRPGIILASDLSRTQEEWKSSGDVAYREQTKAEGQKIYVSENGEVAVAPIGLFDDYTAELVSLIRSGEVDLKKAFSERDFEMIRKIHMGRCGNTFLSQDNRTSLVIASPATLN